MWLNSSLCPSRPPKIVVTWPPPSPLHQLCLVAVRHGDAVIDYTSPPKDVETSEAPCLTHYKEWMGPAGFIWGLPGNWECLHLYVTRFWKFFQFTVGQSFSLQWLLPFNEEDMSPKQPWANRHFRTNARLLLSNGTKWGSHLGHWEGRFCRIAFTWTWAWNVGKAELFGEADFLVLILAVSRFP